MTERETRHNAAPVLQQFVPQNETIAKSPTFVTRNLWNNLPVNARNIKEHEHFKKVIRNLVNNEYVKDERDRLTAGLFNVP